MIVLALTPMIINAQADKKLIDKAHQGNTSAMVILGECYENGAGVEQDSALALQWFRKAADLGDGDGLLRMSRYYLRGTLLPKDTARYFAIRKELADKGHPNALAALATAYEYGYGCKADTAKSIELNEEAVKKGAMWGYENMAVNYYYGLGNLAMDKKKAVAYFEKAIKMGSTTGYDYLARYYITEKEDTKKAWKYVNEGVKWHDPDAITLAAQMLALGTGVEQDEARAQKMMDSLCAKNPSLWYSHSLAGELYMYPTNVGLRDSMKAIRIWRKGAAMGSPFCMTNLADKFLDKEEYDSAYCYLKRAGENNIAVLGRACYMLSRMHFLGLGCEQSNEKAVYWLKRGVEKAKDAQCATILASYYMEEESKDMPLAVKYYRKAYELGDKSAMEQLGKLYANNGNTDRAAECFQEMIDNGDADGYFWMAMLHDMNGESKKCNDMLVKGEKKGSKMAAETLGTIYEYGIDNVKIDNKKAAKYYEKSQTPKSMYRLGLMYINGEVGKQKEQDIAKGMELISRAAEEGYVDAIYTMGYCYETGRNVDTVNHEKAITYFRELADNDIAAGQFKMGLYYELGDGGLEKDSVKALEYYQKAADQGYGEAMCYLGDFYRIGQFLPLDKKKAFELYNQAHESGEPMGTYYVGRSYLEGCGVEIDTLTAIPYLKAAAAQGVGNAAYKVADIYNFGRAGVTADGDTAIAYYVKGHENGSGDASYFLGRLLLNEDATDQAFNYMYTAAQRGNVDGLVTVAFMIQNGIGIEEPDPKAAYKIYENTAHNYGDPRAYCQLGIACLQGNGCPEDEALGKAYSDTAANLGSVQAMHILGICYLNGYGCVPDTSLAIAWLEKAADEGKIESINKLGDVYEEMGDFKNAVLYYEKAVTMGSLEGYCNLGYCYEQGEGVVLNSKKAYELYKYAADQGYTKGYMQMAHCYLDGIYVEESTAEALVWLTKAAENGDVTAMYYCGSIYENGAEGVKADAKKAKEWYKKAAAAGHTAAGAALSRMK